MTRYVTPFFWQERVVLLWHGCECGCPGFRPRSHLSSQQGYTKGEYSKNLSINFLDAIS